MNKVENIEKRIEQLSPAELAELRRWYADFDARIWDEQIETDMRAGKLDSLTEHALDEHTARKSTGL